MHAVYFDSVVLDMYLVFSISVFWDTFHGCKILLLSPRHLLDEDTGQCCPTSIRVSEFMTRFAVTNPEPHPHFSFVNVVTVPFNMAVTMKILVLPETHKECALDWARRAALGTIDSEIPTATAPVAPINPKVTSKVDMKGSICKEFHKFAILDQALVLAVP